MRIVHRVSFNHSQNIGRFERLGVRPKVGDILAVFEIAEDEPNWPAVQAVVDEFGCADLVRTEFTENELEGSALLRMDPEDESTR